MSRSTADAAVKRVDHPAPRPASTLHFEDAMPTISTYPPGTFCWADLAAGDTAVAKDFYSRLFGWTAVDALAGGAGVYTMFQKDGHDVCAAFQMNDEMRQQGVPARWQSYVSVVDVDASAARAAKLGGNVLMPPFDIMKAGRTAVVSDPGGASFALWQPREHPGAELIMEPGSLCWNELYTHDVDAAARFYEGLFGWSRSATASAAGGEYFRFMNGDRPAGGMMKIQSEWGETPPQWSVYFAVDDLERAIEKARGMGGRFVTGTMEVEAGRFIYVRDPQGAHFALIQLVRSAVG
jgi:predicted enzyme related to lactoylglutathione lyase